MYGHACCDVSQIGPIWQLSSRYSTSPQPNTMIRAVSSLMQSLNNAGRPDLAVGQSDGYSTKLQMYLTSPQPNTTTISTPYTVTVTGGGKGYSSPSPWEWQPSVTSAGQVA